MTKISAICLFCGSKTGNDPAYREAARRLGKIIAGKGVRLVYGGGGIGLMGVAVDAALAAGGEVIGVIPEFLARYEVGKPDISELIVVNSMHERKRTMFEKSDAFVIMPGGLGTLDEAMEVITWKQLRLHAKPIVMVDAGGYWKPLKEMIAHVIATGFAHPAVAELFTIVNSVDEVFDAIASAPEPRIETLTDHL